MSPEADARPDDASLVVSLTEAFEDGTKFFHDYPDSCLQAGPMYLASADGIAEAIIGDALPLEMRARFSLSQIPMFRDVIVERARNQSSPLNEVCLFYFDSFFEYSCLNPSEIKTKAIFRALNETMCSLIGLFPPLDEGIYRAFSRWFPHLASQI